MVFLFIILFILLAIFTIKIRLQIMNLDYSSIKINERNLNKNYNFIITIYIFYVIPIYKLKINQSKLINSQKIKEKIKAQEIKILKDKSHIDIKILKNLKNLKIDIKDINLKIKIGTENAATTAIIIPILSTILAIFLRNKIKKYKNQKFILQPIYLDQNLIKIFLEGIFEIKMIHIINTICIVNKERKSDKYERTSNRGAYDYSYE